MYILTLQNKDNHSVNTDFIVSSFNQREVLHQSLKQADDSIRLQVPFSAEVWNFLNANKLIKAKITEDGAAYFTGYVRPDFDYSKIQRFQPIQLELVNATYITSFYEVEESIAFKDTTLGAIVSNLLARAEITGQDTSFLDEPIIFDTFEEGTTVKDALTQILFEYGYFWDFDKNGEFTVQKIYNKNITPSVVLDGTNILEKVQVSKKEQEFDRVEVEYEHLEKFENILIFQDNTGSPVKKGCFIELGPGKYLGQIEGATSYDITYDSDKGEVIWVDNASLSLLSNNKDKVQSTFINKNTKGNLSIYNADQYKSSFILSLEVWGTAYVKTIESATIKVGQDGKNKSIKSKYIHSKKAAENFAKMYYDWGKSCDYVISLQSKLNLDVGTIVEVNTAGKIVGRVIEKNTKLDGKPYTYKIEAIKEYELPKITSSILRKSSPIGTAARGTGILKIDTAPTAYTTPVSGITPAFRISKDVVKSQSKVDEVYTGDILQYSYYQYQVILVADDYVYTAARTSIRGSVGATGATGAKGDTGATGTKTFFSDYNRTWTNEQWNENSAINHEDTWSNSTTDGMRVGDTFVVTATLSEKGNCKGQIFTQITGIDSSNKIISSKTVASLIGERGATGASSRTIAYKINYSSFTATNYGEMYVCGYDNTGKQADIPGYVIVNGAIHYIKGMFNPNVPINGYVAAEIGGRADSPKTPLFTFYDWGTEKYYKIENGQEPAGKTWEQLFTEITNTSDYIVLGKVSNSDKEGHLSFEETTPRLLYSVTEDEENFTYQGVVANTTDMHTSITPYKFSQDAYGNWIKTALNTKTIKKWSFVLCMNAETPNSSTGDPVMKVFTGTWWYEIKTYSAYYSSLQSLMAGDLPAVAGYYDTLGLAVPSICGTYIKTLTSNKAFINELFANDITVGNKISTPFTPTKNLRCYIEYANPNIADSWTTDLPSVYNSSGTKPGTSRYKIRFGHQVPGSSTRIPLEVSFTCQESVTSVSFAFSTVDNPYEIPSSWTFISKTSFPNRGNISSIYKWLFIKETIPTGVSPIIYALPCYTTSTRSEGFEIKSDGSAIFTGKTKFEGGIGIVCDAKDVVRNKSDGLATITYHFPMDFKIYDVIIFLEPATAQGGTILLYKFTCVQYTRYGKTGMNVYKTYDNTSNHSTVIEASVEDDNVGYDSQQYPNGYRDDEHSNMQKVVVKQKTPSFPIKAVKGVIIPYME